MKKYLVKKTKTYEWSYVVEAETKEEATDLVDDYEDKDLCDHYCGCKYSTERINDEIHKDSRKIDKKKTQGMKYLVCTLNDEEYARPHFSVHSKLEDALKAALDAANEFLLASEENGTIEIKNSRTRVETTIQSCPESDCLVSEILPFDPEKGKNLIIWHHAYDGVDFDIRYQAHDRHDCLEKRKEMIRKAFAEREGLTDYNENFDIEEDSCIDTGDEWEVFSIENADALEKMDV